MGDFREVSRNYHTMGQAQQESNKTVLHQKNTRYLKNIKNCFSCSGLKAEAQPTLALGLITIAPCGGKTWDLRI